MPLKDIDLSDFDIVTFDLFDTLLHNLLIDPGYLYTIEEKLLSLKGYAKARVQTERELVGTKQYVLDVILERVLNKLGVVNVTEKVKVIQDLEFGLLKIFLVPNRKLCSILKKALAHRKQIYIITDTFYPSSFLRRILKALCIDAPGVKIISSADVGVFKLGGALYQRVWNQLGHNNARWLHFEDRYSIYHAWFASRTNIRLIEVTSPKDLIVEWFGGSSVQYLGYKPGASEQPLLVPFILGINSHRILEELVEEYPDLISLDTFTAEFWDTIKIADYSRIYTALLGVPLYLALLNWLRDIAIRQGKRAFKLWLLSRDGYNLYRVLLGLKPDWLDINQVRYVYVSRSYLSLLRAVQLNDKDIFMSLYNERTLWEEPDSPPRVDIAERFRFFREQLKIYKEYLSTGLAGRGSPSLLHIFDVGWRGTVPRVFTALLHDSGILRGNVKGVQLGMINRSVTADRLQAPSLDFAFFWEPEVLQTGSAQLHRALWLVELLFSAPYGRFVGFRTNTVDKTLVPVFKTLPKATKRVLHVISDQLYKDIKHTWSILTTLRSDLQDILLSTLAQDKKALLNLIIGFSVLSPGHLKFLSGIKIEVGNNAMYKSLIQSVSKEEFLSSSKKELRKIANSSLLTGYFYVKDTSVKEFKDLLLERGIVLKPRKNWQAILRSIMKWYKFKAALKNPRLVIRWLNKQIA